MKRREFIVLVSSSAVAWRGALAQQPTVPTVGVLLVQSPGSEQFRSGLISALRTLGYAEGQNIRFEFRSDEGKQHRLPELAADLVRLKVDVIVTWFTPAAFAAKAATRDIPIVIAAAATLETGLVASLARPGGNITGISDLGPELDGKMVELLREMLPAARRVAALANASDPFSKPFLENILRAGKITGTVINQIEIRGPTELNTGFAVLQKTRPDAVIVQPSLGLKQPAELAHQYRMPALEHFREFAEAGGLMSYSTVYAKVYPRVAAIVDKILKGTKPADLPVEQPTKFALVINLKTAKALGLAIPPSFLTQADEIIE